MEITESALVNKLERARKIAIELREMGCQLALDDFGTGYSSLRHLRALPFSKLKIDRSFVEPMTYERESRKIVAAVVGLAQSLDMISVAEGVETEEQADMLHSLGCELGQGWLFGRPLLAESIADLMLAAPRTLPTELSAHAGRMALSGLDALPPSIVWDQNERPLRLKTGPEIETLSPGRGRLAGSMTGAPTQLSCQELLQSPEFLLDCSLPSWSIH